MDIDWTTFPSLTALRAFEATARLRSFSAAARKLNVTHAAIAQQVRALEQHLAVPLINKQGRGLALTSEGERLAAALSEGFGVISQGIAALSLGGREHTVHISLTASFAAQWLMPRLRGFWAAHPDIALSLHPDARVVDLQKEGMDVAIRYGMGNWPGVTADYLTSARLVVAASPLLLGDGRPTTVSTLNRLPWILTQNWPEGHNWLRGLGIDPGQIDLTELPTEELAMAAAREGLGLIVESHALLAEDFKSGRMVPLIESDDQLPAYFSVVQPGQHRRAVRIFLKWLSATA
jgi:LysR family transcriptional regulator, glycine cleavage system transcriptional activator